MDINCDLKMPGRFTVTEREGKFTVVAPNGHEVATRDSMEDAQRVADAANQYIDKYNADRDGQYGRLNKAVRKPLVRKLVRTECLRTEPDNKDHPMHHDKIDTMAEAIRSQVLEAAEGIAESAIYGAVNRTVSNSPSVMYAVPSPYQLGSIAIVFFDRDGELCESGWQSGPEHEPDAPPILTIDPLWLARDIAEKRAGDGYAAGGNNMRHRIAALEQSMRLASIVLRDTLVQIDRATAGLEPATAAVIDAQSPGQLEFDVRVPVNVAIPPDRRSSLSDEQLIAEAIRRSPLEFDALRTALAIQLSTLMEGE